jgi:sugar lactone lactonase YvrE|mmetsp:Transcript_84452/g.131934  ORF Transcript_84452/g.131934 Transcript_84452/m.131934 type:complete len:368 (-) Transcript_84452:22-1125(-)
MPSWLSAWCRLALLVAALRLRITFSASPLAPLTEYIIVSQPQERQVSVVEVNALTRQVTRESQSLITSGLIEPCGIAVDHARMRLYVADPQSHKVFMYNLLFGDNGLSVDETAQYTAVNDVTSRWIAVDERGSLFCTDEKRSFIAEVPAEELAEIAMEDFRRPIFHKVHKLFSGEKTREVDKPGGIAVDGISLYWGNRHRGRPVGSLMTAPEDPSSRRVRGVPGVIGALSRNVDKVYGVCASPTAVFYTGGERLVYGAKPGAHHSRALASVVLDDFAHPRGCVWDGDGTMFLADKGNNAVWSFPSTFHHMGLMQAVKLCTVHNPYGIAVFRPTLTLDAIGFLRGYTSRIGPSLLFVVTAFVLLLTSS